MVIDYTVPELKIVDADNHLIVLNKPGMVSVVLGTSQDSQDATRWDNVDDSALQNVIHSALRL